MNAPVPGLAIVREPCARESFVIVHESSSVAVILDLAGPASAELACEALAPLLDWRMSAAGVANAADLLVYLEGAVERVAARFGGTTLGAQAVYAE
jgi:hypothetical protein